MRTILLVFYLLALTNASHAAQWDDPERAKHCRTMVGPEALESEGRSHMGQMNVQRFGDCMMGR
jgi:hypothetical protein